MNFITLLVGSFFRVHQLTGDWWKRGLKWGTIGALLPICAAVVRFLVGLPTLVISKGSSALAVFQNYVAADFPAWSSSLINSGFYTNVDFFFWLFRLDVIIKIVLNVIIPVMVLAILIRYAIKLVRFISAVCAI